MDSHFPVTIGNPESLAFQVGGRTRQLLEVGIWFANREVTWRDRAAFLPTLRSHVSRDLERVKSRTDLDLPTHFGTSEEAHRRLAGEQREHHWFLRWDEIADGVEVLIFRNSNDVTLSCEWHHTDGTREGVDSTRYVSLPADTLAEFVDSASGEADLTVNDIGYADVPSLLREQR